MGLPIHIIPTFTLRQATAPAKTLNDAGTPIVEQQLMLAAVDAPLRYGWGRARLGAHVGTVVPWGQELLLLCVHGKGPIDAVEAVEFDNAPAPAGVQVTHYLGTPGQGVDPWLQAAFAAQGKSYTDTLPGIAYSTLRIAPAPETAFDNIAFIVRQRLVYDPRGTPTTAYRDNPALALADFITSAEFGRGETIDWTTVATCADLNDALVDGVKRRTLSLTISEAQGVDQVERLLETYAGCWAVREGGMVYLVPDAPTAPSLSLTKARQRLDTLAIEVKNRALAPTVVTIGYTNTEVTPWARASVTVKVAGVDAGALPYQESVVELPGIVLPGHALREAYRRLYEAQLSDIGITFTALDKALELRRYDVIEYTDDEGFAAKPFRVIDASITAPGRWLVNAVEYQAGVYSDATSSLPAIDDTNLPDPNYPPAPLAVTAVEELFQFSSFGQYGSRLKITVTPPAPWPFILSYGVEVRAGAETILRVDAPNASPAIVRTPALQEGIAYTVDAVTVSSTGARSSPVSTGVTMLGKALPPGDVPRFDGFEIAGEVLLNWDQVVDIDKVRYEIRSGSTSATWETASVVAVIDSTRATIKGLAAGITRFLIKAIDSVGGYSATARVKDITITSDAGAFVLSNYRFATLTGTGVTAFMPANPSEETWFHLSNGYATTFNALFGSAMDGYTSPLAGYQSSGSSEVEGTTNAFDFGVQVSGNVTASWDVVTLDGTTRLLIGYSVDGSAYTWVEGLSTKQAFRYLKLKAAATGDAVVRGLPTIKIDVVARSESGQVTTLASGGKLVELGNAYFAAQNIQLTPVGATAAMALFDDVQLTPADVRCVRFGCTVTAVPSAFYYGRIAASPSRNVAAGDYLECDVYVDPITPQNLNGNTYIGVFALVTGGTNVGCLTGFSDIGQWRSLSTPFQGADVGKPIGEILSGIVEETNTGVFLAYVRNVRITDGAGTVRAVLWEGGDTVGTVAGAQNTSGQFTKPGNTFRVYAFTDAGAQSAKDVRWQFTGV